jgi:hypothetical protein
LFIWASTGPTRVLPLGHAGCTVRPAMRRKAVGFVLLVAVSVGAVRLWHTRQPAATHPPAGLADAGAAMPATASAAALRLQGCLLGPGPGPSNLSDTAARLRRAALAAGRLPDWPGRCAPAQGALAAEAGAAAGAVVAAAARLRTALEAPAPTTLQAYADGVAYWDVSDIANAWGGLVRALPALGRRPSAPSTDASPLAAAASDELLPIALVPEATLDAATTGPAGLTLRWTLPAGATLTCVSRERGAQWACRRSGAGDAGVTDAGAGDAGARDAGPVVAPVALPPTAVSRTVEGRTVLGEGAEALTFVRTSWGGIRVRRGEGAWHGVVDDGPAGVRGVATMWAVAVEGRVTLFVAGDAVTVWWSDDRGDTWRAAAEAYEAPDRVSLDVGRVRPTGRRR